ncbi:dksA/traR C4-type zinc finger [Humidesulfovibrio mexicanus]|uniref:DksA/traR C4-type zinc finger n=1 Tax=Humidesulfovibrio mexicanus TaxID=147047 RepID=A0A239B7T1_9BACT|nr:TraR/DksA C4-type zinc finger protein [Humidesulfovibrio mexicanus]SNS03368.1 dksA/traR C4-type zinc finger [Humidesulfovibrio mexicanus]
MSGAFETNVNLLCFSSAKEAEASATQAAAVCGGIVVEIGRVEVANLYVSFHGVVPRMMAKARFRQGYTEMTSALMTKPPLPCSLNTTWASILKPERLIGYLVLNDFGPVSGVTTTKEWDEESGPPDTVLCQLRFERTLFSMPTVAHGVTYCEACGSQIPADRVLAVPGVRRCVKCQDN